MVVGEFTQEAQLIVIGAGPGGYTAAFRAAELGVTTVLVDQREHLGGLCLHAGCVPSKTLLEIASTIRRGAEAEQFGVKYGKPKIDLDRVRAWIDETVSKLSNGLATRARQLKVECITGVAEFEDAKTVAVHGEANSRFKFRRCVLAVGAMAERHAAFADFAEDDPRIMTPAAATRLPGELPKRLLIVGIQPWAVELAFIYSALGSMVTLVSESDSILDGADADVLRPMERRLRNAIEAVATGVEVASAKEAKKGGGIAIEFKGKKPPENSTFDAVIDVSSQATTTHLEKLGVSKAGVNRDTASGFVTVDETMKTSNPRVYAVGDITGPPMYAHRAIAQGLVAGEVIAEKLSAFDATVIPHVAFTDPEVAWAGLTETEAKTNDIPHAIAKLPWGASGRAMGMGRVDGLTKLIYDPETNLVLGVALTGVGASEMIAEAVVAIEMGAEINDLALTIHPHPTRSELISDAARSV